MFKYIFTFLFVLIWCTSVIAQDAEVYNGTYNGAFVPEGNNIPVPYSSAAVLHDNGPLATHPAGGFGGADASALQTALLMGTYGYGHQIPSGISIADDFTITGDDWVIDAIDFFAYQTGSTTTSTMTDYYVQIYDGDPSAAGTVIWGDLVTNVLSASVWTNIYRVLDTDLLGSGRPIMVSTVDVVPALTLSAGTYWIEWQAAGTLGSGPWAPPVTVLGSTGTGNAMQNVTGWLPITDVGPQDFPFVIYGTSGGGGTPFFDDFEAYTAGTQLVAQNPVDWDTWSGGGGTAEDPFVSSAFAYSGVNSVVVDGVAPNDFVRRHGDLTTGKWYMSFKFYIPAGQSGYFNTMNEFNDPTFVWGMDCYFDVGGTGRVDTTGGGGGGANNVAFTWLEDQWNQVIVILDLDVTPSVAELWTATNPSNLTMIATWDFTQAGTKPHQLAVNDFFGADVTDEMYMDDYYFSDTMPAIIPVELTSFTANVNQNQQVELNWSTATETNNQMFEIERRTEESQFATIGYVEGHGTTTEPQHYTYTDATVNTGIYFYRLKQFDFLGSYEYFDEIEVDVSGPLSFDLGQNYPNPFNPSTNIKFSVPESGTVSLVVYNLVGEEVAVLVDGFSEAGFFEVTFDASSLPSGAYFYKLQSGNSVVAKKMLLMK